MVRGLPVSKRTLSWKQKVLPASSCSQAAREGSRPVQFPGGVGRRTAAEPLLVFLPKAPALPLESPRAAHPVWAPEGRVPEALMLREAGGFLELSRAAGDASFAHPTHPPATLRAASLGEIGMYHLAQLWKQVSQCCKGTFSCDLPQLKKMDMRVRLK